MDLDDERRQSIMMGQTRLDLDLDDESTTDKRMTAVCGNAKQTSFAFLFNVSFAALHKFPVS